MVSEETPKRIADSLERLTGMLERFEKMPTMPMPGGTGPGFPAFKHRCTVCNIDFGNGALGYYCQNARCPMTTRLA